MPKSRLSNVIEMHEHKGDRAENSCLEGNDCEARN
jgi:hypothetical protein